MWRILFILLAPLSLAAQSASYARGSHRKAQPHGAPQAQTRSSMDVISMQQLSSLVQSGLMGPRFGLTALGNHSRDMADQPVNTAQPRPGQMQCPFVPATVSKQAACRAAHGRAEPVGVVFKDRQAVVPSARWSSMHEHLYSSLDPSLAEELEPYLYDMDYVTPSPEDSLHNHMWDPELRQSGGLHCQHPEDCITPYLPELYYVGDEYMGGWALGGFDGEGLRSAIGPNIAPGDNPRDYNYTYIPYKDRIIFAPAASLFFPYLMSIYAGDIYTAEVDPLLTVVARAARAGIVEDYYYVNNYYTAYSFITTGVATAAVFSATARARGLIGAALKLRNFNAVLASVSRDDYNERTRILLLNSIAFGGISGGGYLFSTPNQRNAFIGQNPNTQLPYYAYDYAGAVNPFPLQPATG